MFTSVSAVTYNVRSVAGARLREMADWHEKQATAQSGVWMPKEMRAEWMRALATAACDHLDIAKVLRAAANELETTSAEAETT